MRKKSETVRVKLDKNKLFEVIRENDMSPQILSEKLGYNRDYITNLFSPSKDDSLSFANTLAICNLLNISIEEIKANLPETGTEEENKPVDLDTINTSLLVINETLKELVSVYRKAWIDEH